MSLAVFGLLFSACKPENSADVTLSSTAFLEPAQHFPKDLLAEDIIPDFSTVGYAHGDREAFPDYENVVEVPSPSGADDTQMIQEAIDNATEGSVIRLKDGTYQVGGVLILDKNRVILRGAGRDNTVIHCTGTLLRPGIVVGATVEGEGFSGRLFRMDTLRVKNAHNPHANVRLDRWHPALPPMSRGAQTVVSDTYCPVGRDTVVVADASAFDIGCDVLVERPHSARWVADVRMTDIWTKDMSMEWTRKIKAIEGNRLILDAPLVQSLDRNYGGGLVSKYKLKRVRGSGVENLTLDAEYDPSVKNEAGVEIDENHAWYGVYVLACEDCFVRGVTVRHFGFSAVSLASGSRCVTVEDCAFVEPVSVPTMARRYGFGIEGAELCLVKNCLCEKSAIGFGTNLKGGGPNVYTHCRGENMRTGSGPHLHWSTGTLFDCCYNSAGFRVTDHGNAGTGHGWTGANTIFWNVETEGSVECESPWAAENTPGLTFSSPHPSGRNYCIGLVGGTRVQKRVDRDFYGNPVEDYYQSLGFARRPDAKWYPYVDYGQGGSAHISLPDAEAQVRFDWWPRLTITRFSDPLSLYQCQLENRRKTQKKQ